MAVVRVEFHGGCKDGEVVVGNDNTESLSNPARSYLFLTDNGRLGARFREIPPKVELQEAMAEIKRRGGPVIYCRIHGLLTPTAMAEIKRRGGPFSEAILEILAEDLVRRNHGEIQHTYQVTGREEQPDEIRIRLDFAGMELPHDRG